MKKCCVILVLCLYIIPIKARPQSAEIEQLLLNLEKLSQFKKILQNMVDGYQILHQGYTTIKDISEGNFSLHQGFLDGLRLYPIKARMRTSTYDPLLGKTSETDENNRTLYYEYDNQGRLQFIKDEERNIIKTYEYNSISPSKQNGCPGIYYNKLISETYRKENCGSGYTGSEVIINIPANTYSSIISQDDADSKAQTYLYINGQSLANSSSTGFCSLIYYNDAFSQTFTKENCDPGKTANITYSVPAQRYSSIISKQDANDKALDEITANGQAYANDPANGTCTIITTPQWEAPENPLTQCQQVSGQMHLFAWATDVNPYSSTYNQSMWKDLGPDASCPPVVNNVMIYYNNYSWYSHYVTLINNNTNEYYYFYMDGNTTGNLGEIKEGDYTIHISSNYNSYFDYIICSTLFNSGFNGASFYNVQLDGYCSEITVYDGW